MEQNEGSVRDPLQATEQLEEGLDKCHELVSHLRFSLTSLEAPSETPDQTSNGFS